MTLCGHHVETRPCGAADGVRFYVNGHRCPAHTPAALAGKPEASGQYCAPPRCYCGQCDSGTAVPARNGDGRAHDPTPKEAR